MDTIRRVIRTITRRPNLWWATVALSVYTLTTVVMTYPVPFRLNSVIIGAEHDGDAYRYAWALWWAKQTALKPGIDLAHLSLLNHPVGIELVFMLTGIAVNLQALPFSLLLPPAAVYNIQILLSFILSGMTMYWFCAELTGDRRAGLVGGFVFAFFLNKTGHVLGGHLPQATVYWVPLYTLFLWRTLQQPAWGTALIAGLALAPACLVHVVHLPFLVLPVTMAVLLIALLRLRRDFFTRRRLGSLALVYGLAALLAGPFLLPTVLHFGEGADYLYKTGTIASSTDLLAFFTPSRYHPVLGPLGLVPSFAERTFPSLGSIREGLAYPGALATGLAVWGLIRRRRAIWIWGMFALAAAVLSLGPLLKIGDELVLYEVERDMVESHIVLPYALIKQMPLLDIGRTSSRLNEMTMFAMAILASYGVAELSPRFARRPRLFASLLGLMLIVIGFEYVAIWPFPVSSAEIPPAMQSIAHEPDDGALLYLGMDRREVNHRALYYQTVVHRSCVGGSVHRMRPEIPPWWETLSALALPDPAAGDAIPRPSLADRIAWLRYFDVDYVVLHRHTMEWHDPRYRGFAETMLGTPRYTDRSLVAFPVPDEVPPPHSARLYAFSQQGWYPPEQDGDVWRRWMSDEGQVYLYSTRDEVGTLRFTVDSALEFPILEVYLGQQLLDSFVVGQRATHTTRPFTLTQGMNVLRFHTQGGCHQVVDDPRCWSKALLVPPADPPSIPCDPEAVRTTCRTFVLDHISFAPQGELLPGEALDINFGDRVHLRGWGLDETVLSPGATLTVTLAWEATVELSDQYVVFVHLLSPDETLVAQQDGPPVGQLLPSSAWVAGTAFSYPVAIQLPAELPAGEYRLMVGVYLWPSLERLAVLEDVPGAETRVVDLGSVRIMP